MHAWFTMPFRVGSSLGQPRKRHFTLEVSLPLRVGLPVIAMSRLTEASTIYAELPKPDRALFSVLLGFSEH